MDTVDPHSRVASAEFDRQATRQRRNGALAGEVGSVVEVGPRQSPVADVYDGAAFLLPHRSPDKKKDVWEDMKMLLTRMGRPIPTPKK